MKILTTLRCTKTYTLNNGAEIPAIGFGTFRSTGEECYNSVKAALENGYTLIDTSSMYE